MPKMTADEAIEKVWWRGRCYGHTRVLNDYAPNTAEGREAERVADEEMHEAAREAGNAEAAIREAFAVRDLVREELASLEVDLAEYVDATKDLSRDELAVSREHKLGWRAADRVAMLKRIIGGEGS